MAKREILYALLAVSFKHGVVLAKLLFFQCQTVCTLSYHDSDKVCVRFPP